MSIEQKLLEFEQIYSEGYDKTTEDVCCAIQIDVNEFYEWKTSDKFSERIKSFFTIQKTKRIDHLQELAMNELAKKVLPRIETINIIKVAKKVENNSQNQLVLIEPNTQIVAINEEVHTRTVPPSSADLKYVIEQSKKMNDNISIAGGQLDLSVLNAEEQAIILPLINKIINHGNQQ